MSNKVDNARILDPNRFKIAKNMAVMPGGAENNNPMNVTDIDTPPIQAPSIYGDYAQQYAQMGTGMVNPGMIPHSKLLQSQVQGQDLNYIPYGMEPQPDISGVSMAPDGMESGRLAGEAQQQGLFAGPMGMMGQPVVRGTFPGAFPGSNGPPMMQGMPSAEMAAGQGVNTRTGKRGK